MDENAELNHKYFFALMLRDSSNHLPTIIDNLLRVIYHLGEQNIFMSIYEGGSTDDGHTTAMIDTIKTTMETIGIEHHIEVDVRAGPSPQNAVLAPLKSLHRSEGRVFNTVVMMGDDLWCAEGFLDLLFHSRGQAASITCSTDVQNSVLPILYNADFRTINSLFLLATILTGNSSNRYSI
jgi:alpha-1,3-mannosyltransferase